MEPASRPLRKCRLSPQITQFHPQDPKMSQTLTKLFNKRFELSPSSTFVLPAPEQMFVAPPWQIEAMQVLKESLNLTKSQLNDFPLMEWHSHTRRRNPAGEVHWRLRNEVNPELLTQAWCKFYENVSSFPLIPPAALASGTLTSVHLCEAPGAFITSLNHYLKLNHPEIKWSWTASTLNPHYEGNSISTMINDDRLILHTADHWYFGEDDTGDLMSLKNLEGLVQRGKATLVTADGSISCIDRPDEQEAVVAHLHYCEAVAAIHIWEEGGSLLLKIFTIFEQQTICLMYLLRCCFDRVILNKPATSKEGNSEVYVVCLGFRGEERVERWLGVLRGRYEEGSEAPMFRREDLPEEFVREIIQAGEFFKGLQCEVIEGNIRTFAQGVDEEGRNVRAIVAEEFLRRYGVRRVRGDMEIVGKRRIGMFSCGVMESRFCEESFNDRRRKKGMLGGERIRRVQEELRGVVGDGRFVFHVRILIEAW